MFPFLSVLVCVIGVLTLMIAAIAMAQMDDDAVAEIEEAEQYERNLERIEEYEEQQDELQALIAEAEAIANQLDQARRELERLEEEEEEAEEREEEFRERNLTLLAEADNLRREIRQLEEELEELREQIEQIKEEIEEREKPPDPPDVVIQPGGTGEFDAQAMDKVVFVECRSDAIYVYHDLDGEEVERFSNRNMDENLDLIRLLDRWAVNDNRIVFLVRDDARRTLSRAESVASSRGVYNGKLPLIGHGEIDLSVFREALEGGGQGGGA